MYNILYLIDMNKYDSIKKIIIINEIKSPPFLHVYFKLLIIIDYNIVLNNEIFFTEFQLSILF